MKIAITGATGFIARHLIPLLAAQHEVIAIARFENSSANYPWLKGTQKISLDITNTKGDVFALMGKPDKLIHLAWGGLPNYKSSAHLIEGVAHLLFLKNALEGGLRDLTATGTCFEYGMRDGELSEDDITLPANPYGLAKDSLRKALEFLTTEQKCVFRWTRLFYMYGEGQNPNSLLAQLDRAIEEGKPIFNMSGGDQLRDYLPVEKVAAHIASAVMQEDVCGIINCCNGKPISIRTLVEKRIKEKSAKIALNLGHYPYPDYEPMAFWGDNRKYNCIIRGKTNEPN